jgi:hypothetical protein
VSDVFEVFDLVFWWLCFCPCAVVFVAYGFVAYGVRDEYRRAHVRLLKLIQDERTSSTPIDLAHTPDREKP